MEVSWDMPEELEEGDNTDDGFDEQDEPQDQMDEVQDEGAIEDGGIGSPDATSGADDEYDEGQEGEKKRARPVDENALEPDSKRQKRVGVDADEMAAIPIPLLDDEAPIENLPAAALEEVLRKKAYEEQLKAAEVRYEEKVSQWKQLLRDKGIGPTDTWSKTQPVLAADPRFNCTIVTQLIRASSVIFLT